MIRARVVLVCDKCERSFSATVAEGAHDYRPDADQLLKRAILSRWKLPSEVTATTLCEWCMQEGKESGA